MVLDMFHAQHAIMWASATTHAEPFAHAHFLNSRLGIAPSSTNVSGFSDKTLWTMQASIANYVPNVDAIFFARREVTIICYRHKSAMTVASPQTPSGFYPVNADSSKKTDDGQKGVS